MSLLRFATVFLAIAGFVSTGSEAKMPRDHRQLAAFKRLHPCPATGKSRGACPGYVVDHINPLCARGADHHTNMQWQTIAAAKIKDREERAECRRYREGRT